MELESTILYLCERLEAINATADTARIMKNLDALGIDRSDFDNQIKELVIGGFLSKDQHGNCVLTAAGKEKAGIVSEEYQRNSYNQFMLKIWKSKAYLDFCEDLYGYRWCLLNSLYKAQFQHLFHELDIRASDTVLDVGCGSGAILNNLVNRYSCKGIGIDYVSDLIPILKKNYPAIEFHEMDINTLPAAPFEADVIVSVDSLYTSKDLTSTIASLKKKCRRQIYAFYTQEVNAEDGDRTSLNVDSTDIAKACRFNRLKYSALDFSSDEFDLWEREKEILDKHKKAFEAEGTLEIWDGRVADTDKMLKFFGDERAKRFVFAIET